MEKVAEGQNQNKTNQNTLIRVRIVDSASTRTLDGSGKLVSWPFNLAAWTGGQRKRDEEENRTDSIRLTIQFKKFGGVTPK